MLLGVKQFGIILAGGSGQRFGDQIPKQFIRLAGESVLRRSVVALASGGPFDQIVVAANPDWLQETKDGLKGLEGINVSVVPGGSSRNESTRAALDALNASDDDIVLIHDAVRPLLHCWDSPNGVRESAGGFPSDGRLHARPAQCSGCTPPAC